MTQSPKDTICRLRWDYPIVNFGRGDLRTCCRTPAQKITQEDIDLYGTDIILNSPYQKERRLEMLKGIRHSDCNTCWKQEDLNMHSFRFGQKDFMYVMKDRETFKDYRNMTLEEIGEKVGMGDPILTAADPLMLEISLGNTCDLKCLYCNHHYSSQWQAELVKFGEINPETHPHEFPKPPSKYEEVFWQWMDQTGRPSLRHIGIIGGEPLTTPAFYPLLERLISMYRAKPPGHRPLIWIVTNLNTPPVYFNRFLDYIPQIKEFFDLEIHASMESVGRKAEYIRSGLNWARFDSNLHTLMARPAKEFAIGCQMAINNLCATSLLDYLKYVKELNEHYNKPLYLKQNMVTYPQWMSPMILPKTFIPFITEVADWLAGIDREIAEDGSWSKYETFMRHIATGMNAATPSAMNRKTFYEQINKLDSRRGTSFLNTFPEYEDFYNICKDSA